ncbi:hypothetical protein C8R47DRAFT_563207 [Mycena vitilis]|nr:hypothetical protein C8R47DRAFT_563207 [Mycena vitilis]
MATSRISKRFYAADAEVTVSSSDGILFKVYRKNLETHSGVFAGAGRATLPENGDEIVQLSETAEVIDLLTQFMYPLPQPDLETLEFTALAGLAEAAEKYMVFSALTLCRTQMRNSIPAHPLEVLIYALRHDHDDLANEAAEQSMGCGVAEAMETLPWDTFRAWILFYERWHKDTIKSLGYLTMFPKHLPLVQKCAADPNPACTFRKELDEAGGWSRTIRGMRFLNNPKIAQLKCKVTARQANPPTSGSEAVWSF